MKDHPYVKLIGKKFHLLTVKEISNKRDRKGRTLLLCECVCKNKIFVYGQRLTSGHTKSCGCWRRDRRIRANTTHGKCRTPEYSAWCNMKNRCYNKNVDRYDSYGGRGICVCKRWRNSFQNFYADIGPRPSPTHSIERKNVNKNYSPTNCVWIEKKYQSRNRTDTERIKIGHDMTSIAELSEKLHIRQCTLKQRIKRNWPIKKIIETPVKH